jgi:lysophospholipase L1-like esterase
MRPTSWIWKRTGHESLFIPYDGDHPNAAGHAIAAREITKALRTTFLGAARTSDRAGKTY